MSSAKAALESDTRTLAWEAGRRYGCRVNTISAGPLKSRAASAIGKGGERTFIELCIDYSRENAPLGKDLYAEDVGSSALFLCSDLARSVTGVTLYVDNGLHAMGMAVDSSALAGAASPCPRPTRKGARARARAARARARERERERARARARAPARRGGKRRRARARLHTLV